MEPPPQATAFTSRLKGIKGLMSTTGDSDSTEDEACESTDEVWYTEPQDWPEDVEVAWTD